MPRIRHPIQNYRSLPPPQKFKLWRRIWRSIIGFTVLGLGVIMIVAPGPAIVVIPVGLAILATEYAWARRYLSKFKQGGEKLGTILLPNWKKGK
jgi:tellurite resistance protein TerC